MDIKWNNGPPPIKADALFIVARKWWTIPIILRCTNNGPFYSVHTGFVYPMSNFEHMPDEWRHIELTGWNK